MCCAFAERAVDVGAERSVAAAQGAAAGEPGPGFRAESGPVPPDVFPGEPRFSVGLRPRFSHTTGQMVFRDYATCDQMMTTGEMKWGDTPNF